MAAVVVAVLALPSVGAAQDAVEFVFSSPPSPVGAGARATGIGSAFIAVADDATAASWNPAGLMHLERPEMSIVGRGSLQFDDIGSATEVPAPGYSTSAQGQSDQSATGDLNYVSFGFPFTVKGVNLVASINYQQMLSFERDLHVSLVGEEPGFSSFSNIHLVQEGGIDAVTPAIAIEPLPGLSFGGSLNFWVDGLKHDFAWAETVTSELGYAFEPDPPTIEPNMTRDTFSHFRGVNVALGLLWKLNDALGFGAVYKMPFQAGVHHVYRNYTSGVLSSQDDELQFPPSYGGGLRWSPADHFMVSADVTYVEWGQFRTINSTGEEFLVTGDPAGSASVDGVFTERLGLEYLWLLSNYTLALRGGAFLDPEPSRGAPKNYYGGSVGLGCTFPDFSVDFAYQARFTFDAKSTNVATQFVDLSGVELDSVRHAFYLSIIKYF